MVKSSQNRRIGTILRLDRMNLLPDQALRMSNNDLLDKFLQAWDGKKKKPNLNSVKNTKRIIRQTINLGKQDNKNLNKKLTKKKITQEQYEISKKKINLKSKKRRENIVIDTIKTLKKRGHTTDFINKSKTRIHLNVNKVKTNNKYFTKLTNDLIEKMGLDRNDAIKQADILTKTPKIVIDEMLADSKKVHSEIEVYKEYLNTYYDENSEGKLVRKDKIKKKKSTKKKTTKKRKRNKKGQFI